MPERVEKSTPNWDKVEKECQDDRLMCPWTMNFKDESVCVCVVVTRLKWTFNYDFRFELQFIWEETRNCQIK